MLWFIAFKCPEWESQLCHKENNWIGNGFFSWQQSPWRLWGWEGASLFSLCPALPCYCGFMKAFPTKHWRWLLTLSLKQMWPHRMWNPGARVSPPGMLGLVPRGWGWSLCVRQVVGREFMLCCSHTVPTIYFNPQPASQQGRAGGSPAAPLCYATKANSMTCCVGS